MHSGASHCVAPGKLLAHSAGNASDLQRRIRTTKSLDSFHINWSGVLHEVVILDQFLPLSVVHSRQLCAPDSSATGNTLAGEKKKHAPNMCQKKIKAKRMPTSAWNLMGENAQVITPTANVIPVN